MIVRTIRDVLGNRRVFSFAFPLALPLLVAVPAGLLGGCDEREVVAPPPPEVGVAQPIVREVTRYAEFTGRTEAAQVV